MRTAQKNNILEMIDTLHQAHDEIRKYIELQQYIAAQDMLTQCQECAINIGTAIEKSEGEGDTTVTAFEEYCDILFHIHEELNEKKDININKIYKTLKKHMLKIESSVKHDIPVRKEVVFLPYKASMWDALESVWKAAAKDPGCDAYVIPIPYYDKNPDGSFRQMNYEGNQYPEYVPIINYEKFDFEEHHPDAIFIHNPYDNINFVTSVHPFFYSSNLKKYTDKLIYIPYFVMGKVSPENEDTIRSKQHYCTTPGVLNADRVIVESEEVRQIYIKALTKAIGQGSKKIWEEKILGFGSPKFDKVVSTKKEELEIPSEWLRIIQKPNGSWKKIIFYNTSISALLDCNEKMLEKMKSVFRIFKENQDKVALLWRPHPLIQATVSSMRPQLWESYKKIVEQYREEGWGIYDDSADMDRAVILSDAYYGDRSSVVYLYQKAGKLVMIQDARVF